MNVPAIPDFSPAQLTTIRQTVAKEANDTEFDLFMSMAKQYGLDPFRKQLHLIIYNKDKPEKRSHAIFPSRDGFRVIAARQGDYRPASKPADFEYSDDLKGPANPKGIILCRVTLHKKDPQSGEWFDVMGEAYWDEFVQLREEWAYNQEAGKRQPTGKFEPNGNWKTMPNLMIQKCAEGQALRAGWPDAFGGLYHEEELRNPNLATMKDITPSETVNEEAKHRRGNLLGDKAVMMVFDPSGVLERVPMGSAIDRCVEYIESNEPEEVLRWSEQNREAFRELWADNPNDALEMKAKMEAKVQPVIDAMQTQEADA